MLCFFPSDDEGYEYLNGFIYNRCDKDYLCVSGKNGKIYIWGLIQKKIFKMITIGVIFDNNTINKWNNRYAINVNFSANTLSYSHIGKIKTVDK